MNEKLFELFNFCSKNNIDFNYETSEDGKNEITHIINKNERVIMIKIVDPEEKNLNQMIDNKINEIISQI